MNPVSGIIACLGKGPVTTMFNKILDRLEHRAPAGYFVYPDLKHLAVKDIKDERCFLAAVCLRENSNSPPFPFHGSIYEPSSLDITQLKVLLDEARYETLCKTLSEVDGSFAFVNCYSDKLVFARDAIGQKPLFITYSPDFIAICSEFQALKFLNKPIISVPPGVLIELSLKARHEYPFSNIQVNPQNIESDEAAIKITNLLKKSVKARSQVVDFSTLGFSGGLDSSILAKLISNLTPLKLFCISVRGSRDSKWAEYAAKLLELDVNVVYVDAVILEKRLNNIRRFLQNCSLMNLSIGLGIRLASEATHKVSNSLMVGQLADELFGGYKKYQVIYQNKGPEETRRLMVQDVLSAHVSNFERDELVSAPYVDLISPYASLNLVKYVLQTKTNLHIDPHGQRKMLLQKVGKIIGLPDQLISAPKKAFQYSSGIEKVVKLIISQK